MDKQLLIALRRFGTGEKIHNLAMSFYLLVLLILALFLKSALIAVELPSFHLQDDL